MGYENNLERSNWIAPRIKESNRVQILHVLSGDVATGDSRHGVLSVLYDSP